MKRLRLSTFHALLVLALLFSQQAAIVHVLSHVVTQPAAVDDGRDGEQKGNRLTHVCHECLAYSTLDLPLAASHRHEASHPDAVAAGLPQPAGVATARVHYFDSRAPPLSL